MSFLNIAQQCCDASDYVANGIMCANGVKCYGELRPIGDYLWFAIPTKLGWPLESLIAIHFAMTAISALLSVFALEKLLPPNGAAMIHARRAVWLLLSLVIHCIFVWPTIFNALSDPPTNMLLLSGIWLLVLAHHSDRTGIRVLLFLVVGLFLGFSAWLRTFYLYPVLVAIALYILLWIISSNKKWVELLILVALLPIGTQYLVMYREYGTIGYIGAESNKRWSELHLNSTVTGYDTVLPRNGYAWQPQFCEAKLGILNGLAAGDYKSMACVIAGRLYLYFGTYESKTYLSSSVKNKLVSPYFESIGSPEWYSTALDWEENVELAPDGKKTADKLIVDKPAPDGAGDVVQWVSLRGNTPYTFSVWLWSPVAKTINLYVVRQRDPVIVALKQFTLSPVPMRYSVTGTTSTTGMYDIGIGRSIYKDEKITFGTESGDFLVAWGAQLEEGDHMTNYNGIEVALPDSIRKWYPALLVVNGVMLLFCVTIFIRYRQFWLQHRAGISVLAIFLVAMAEGVAIIPEQRFAIGWMIFFWLITSAFLSNWLFSFFMKNKLTHSKNQK